MERIKVLINKLQEQAEQQTDPSQMLSTAQLLQAEIQSLLAMRGKTIGTSKVSVVMPHQFAKQNNENNKWAAPEMQVIEPVALNKNYFDPLTEIPTLSHQPAVKDFNETASNGSESLNDKLKEQKTELAEKLNEVPIQSLGRAIGINDKYLFIAELFRNDDSMYERCIKTIDNFNNFSDAENWISRELQVKLGWDINSETVAHFYQLVKRRFS